MRCLNSAIRLSFKNRTATLFGLAAIALPGIFLATGAIPCRAQAPTRSGINDRNGFDRPAPKSKKPSTPPPRAISVLEWTPDVPATQPKPTVQPAGASGPATSIAASTTASKDPLPAPTSLLPTAADLPKSARLVPVSIYYQGAFQDAGVFLSQPTPLALQADTVYDLEKAGDPAGTFTLHSAARHQDTWLGYGVYAPKPPPAPFKPNVPNAKMPAVAADEEEGDRPVLKRRSTSDSGAGSGQSGDAKNSTQAPPDINDPDRPILKRPASASTTPAPAPAGADDPDHPKLERKPASAGAASNPRTSDDYLNPADDANRPHIRRGAFREKTATLPELLGNPENIRQTVAVSDSARSDEHPFAHIWNDNAERDRTRDAMQKLALQQLAAWGKTNSTPATRTAHSTTHTAATHAAPAAHPAASTRTHKAVTVSPEFSAVQFAAYDLAYQDEPTYIFAAQTTASALDQKFVTVIARPDIYGNLQVVYSAITDGSHLGLTPRYRLVDAVDADGDGRAELLLEARNLDGRRFVLLDVYRGAANKVFETGLLP